MLDTRTQHRRASARHGKDGNGAAPSVLEIVMSYLTDRIALSALRRAKRGAREVVRRTVLALVLGWVGAAVTTGGIFLLLGAGVKGLEALHCPLWLCYLSTGIAALLIALVAMKDILRRKDEGSGD